MEKNHLLECPDQDGKRECALVSVNKEEFDKLLKENKDNALSMLKDKDGNFLKEVKIGKYKYKIFNDPNAETTKELLRNKTSLIPDDEEYRDTYRVIVVGVLCFPDETIGRDDFSFWYFLGCVSLVSSKFAKVSFDMAFFGGALNISSANFAGLVSFSGTSFTEKVICKQATFQNLRCLFVLNKPTTRTTFNGDVEFSKCTFNGNVEFERTNFNGNVDFPECTFNGDVDFSKSTFNGNVRFDRINFNGNVDFGSVYFSKKSNFSKSKFYKNALFNSTNFKDNAYFIRSQFGMGIAEEICNPEKLSNKFEYGYVKFECSIFASQVFFDESKFLSDVYFIESNFDGSASFNKTEFEKDFSLYGSIFQKHCNLKVKKFGNYIEFVETVFTNSNTPIIDIEKLYFGKKGIFFKKPYPSTVIRSGKKEYTENKRNLFAVKQICERTESNQDLAYNFHFWYKRYKRKCMPMGILKVWDWLLEKATGYFLEPIKVFITMILNILGFALIYCIPGCSISSGTKDTAYTYCERFLESAYFSVVTFVTLGYGDYSPTTPPAKFFASIEAILGVVLIALFSVVLSNRYKEK